MPLLTAHISLRNSLQFVPAMEAEAGIGVIFCSAFRTDHMCRFGRMKCGVDQRAAAFAAKFCTRRILRPAYITPHSHGRLRTGIAASSAEGPRVFLTAGAFPVRLIRKRLPTEDTECGPRLVFCTTVRTYSRTFQHFSI